MVLIRGSFLGSKLIPDRFKPVGYLVGLQVDSVSIRGFSKVPCLFSPGVKKEGAVRVTDRLGQVLEGAIIPRDNLGFRDIVSALAHALLHSLNVDLRVFGCDEVEVGTESLGLCL